MKFFKVFILFILFCFSAFKISHAEEVLLVMWHNETDAERSFVKRLKELRPGVKFRKVFAKRKKSELANILRTIDMSGIDLIHSAGTTSTMMVKQFLQGSKPVVFNLVSDPVQSKIVKSLEKPENNTTGVRFLVYPQIQLKILNKIKKIKRLGVWFDPREKHNTVMLQQVQDTLKKMGIEFVPIRVIPDAVNSNDILDRAAQKSKAVDAVYFIVSYSFYSNFKRIFSRLDPSILSIASLSSYTKAGATIAIASDLNERSSIVAEQAHAILNGKDAGSIPVDLVTEDKAFLFVNRERLAAAGIKNIEKLGYKIKFIKPDP